MVGSRDYYRSDIHGEVNNTLAVYQPGSALKPAVYLAAFLKGWSPGTLIDDTKVCYPNGATPFCPSGPTLQHVGPLPARVALGSSMNSPAVQTAAFDTVQGVLDVAHRMGIDTMPDAAQFGVAIATGGSQVTLYDMTYMYSTIANNGDMRGLRIANPKPGYRQVDPVAVLAITDRTGTPIYQFRSPDHFQAEPAPYVYEISNILQDDAAKHLTYSPGLFDIGDHRPIAAKTGTQQGETVSGVRATWNFGYIPDLTVGVWVGNADGAFENPNLLSATSSLMVWKDIMKLAVQLYHIPPKNFVVPAGIARGLPTPPGVRLVGCGIQPDIYVVGQPIAGPPLIPGRQACSLNAAATPAPLTAGAATGGPVHGNATGSSGPGVVPSPAGTVVGPASDPVPTRAAISAPTQAPASVPAVATRASVPPPGTVTQPAPSLQPPPVSAPTAPRLRCPPGLRLPPGVARASVCQ